MNAVGDHAKRARTGAKEAPHGLNSGEAASGPGFDPNSVEEILIEKHWIEAPHRIDKSDIRDSNLLEHPAGRVAQAGSTRQI